MAFSASAATDSQAFLEQFGFEIVDLHVGPALTGKLFRVHKKLLCDKIPYFNKMFTGGFAEARNYSASFPEDSIESFDLMIQWVYTGVLQPYRCGAGSEMENWGILQLYILAEKFCLPQLQDYIMDILRASHVDSHCAMGTREMARGYESTQEGSGYRLYALHSLMFVLRFKGDKSLKTWKNTEIVEMLKRCPDICMDYLTLVREHLSQKHLKPPVDPRRGDACVYHSHKNDEQCLLKSKRVEAEGTGAPNENKISL